MDIEKMAAFFPQYLSEYLSVLFRTLLRPTVRFSPDERPKGEEKKLFVIGSHPENSGIQLNPKLISFVILSIFLGSILQSITPNHPPIRELPTLIVTIVAIWLSLSSILFVIFRLFGGKGGFGDTISVGLQLFASIYVLASLVSFIATALIFANDRVSSYWYYVYLATEVVLWTIYLPLALKGLHFPSTNVSIRFVVAIALSILIFLFVVTLIFASTFIPACCG